MLKFEAYRNALLFSEQNRSTSLRSSNQPVVPQTTGISSFKADLILVTADSGTLKLMATSASESLPSSLFLSIFATIECPLSIAIFSMVLPILPYPKSAIFML